MQSRRMLVGVMVGALAIAGVTVAAAGAGKPRLLDGTVGKGWPAGIVVAPGQLGEFTAFVANHTGFTATLQSVTARGDATLGPVAMFTDHHGVAAARWPYHPRVVRLRGYRLANGDTRNIWFTAKARSPGRYDITGLWLTARVDGQTERVLVMTHAEITVRRGGWHGN